MAFCVVFSEASLRKQPLLMLTHPFPDFGGGGRGVGMDFFGSSECKIQNGWLDSQLFGIR